jgi:hypothetical protein
MVPLVLVRKGERLLPRCGLIGMVHSAHHSGRRLGGTRPTVVDHGPRQTLQVFAGYLGFQTGEGGSAGAVLRSIERRPRQAAFAKGGTAAVMGVMRLRIPRSTLRDALGAEGPHAMVHIRGLPLLVESGGAALRPTTLTVDTTEQECTKVRRQGSTREICTDRLTGNKRKTELFWARRGQKHTSCGFARRDWTRILFYQRLTRGLSIVMKHSGYDAC